MMLRAIVIASAITMAAAGCGGSSDATSSGSSSLSRAEFIKQASAACKRERAGVGERVSSFLKIRKSDGTPDEVLYADLAHFVLLPTIEREIFRIEELGIPPGDEKRIDAMLSAERLAIDEVATTKRIESVEAVERRFIDSGKLVRSFGLPACANGPKPGGEGTWPPVRF